MENDSQKGVSRRRALALGGACLGALAGCSGTAEQPENGTSEDGRVSSDFPGTTSLEGRDLVVEFPAGHDVQKVTMIDPDGELFASRSVPVGVTQVRFKLLDPQPQGSSYVHYEPGTYDLIANTENGTSDISVDLVPEIRLISVDQHRDDEIAGKYVRLVVEVENVGTGPTWVHDITYDGTPYGRTDNSLWENPGDPVFVSPSRYEVPILKPSDQQQFIDNSKPLLFDDEEDCRGKQYQIEVFVGVATKDQLKREMSVVTDGNALKDSLTNKWKCSSVEVELIDGS